MDLSKPEKEIVKNLVYTCEKYFKINDRVICRNYINYVKWKLGRVKERLGNLHYSVLLDDNTVRKCHVNQMCKVGENIVSQEMCENYDYYVLPENQRNVLSDNGENNNNNQNDSSNDESFYEEAENNQEPVVNANNRVLRNRNSLQLPDKLKNDFIVQMPKKK